MIIPDCRACPRQCLVRPISTSEKRELVILLKPTVVDSDKDWSDDIMHSRDRVNGHDGEGIKPLICIYDTSVCANRPSA